MRYEKWEIRNEKWGNEEWEMRKKKWRNEAMRN